MTTDIHDDFNIEQLYGCPIICADGKCGSINSVFVDEEKGHPVYVTVRSGLFGSRETFLPLDDAVFEDGRLLVPYQAEQIKRAPSANSTNRLDVAAEENICQHYGIEAKVDSNMDSAGENSQDPHPKPTSDSH